MKYKTNRLARLYIAELGEKTRQNIARAYAALKAFLWRALRLMALWWRDSLQYRYLRYRCMDCARAFRLLPRSAYAHMAVCLCSLMSLGFITTSSPADETPNYYLRVSINRPQITQVQPAGPRGLLTQDDLRALRAAGLTPENSAWFAAGSAMLLPETADLQKVQHRQNVAWNSSNGLLGVSAGRVVLHTALGAQGITAMAQVGLQINSTPLPQENLGAVASGRHNPESLLAELGWRPDAAAPDTSGQRGPDWSRGKYGAAVFGGPQLHWNGAELPSGAAGGMCRSDRMETASWLAILRLENIAGNSSRNPAQYREYVERFSGHYALSPSLVYAIMRVESSFNPVAVSSANALGLMQVVPQTAGGEVHAYLTGKRGTPRPELLFTPESNIQYGTTYLHLLRDRHFKDVKNPLSREICIVAAYNCGPNPVYRVFNRDRQRALEQMNGLTPDQLYYRLVQSLPSQETRDYLPKVIGARNDFLRGPARF